MVLTSRRKPDAEFSDLPWIKGDLNSFSDCQQAIDGTEAIQHLGAQPNPVDHPQRQQQAQENGIPFDATFKINMLGTYYLMQAAVKAKVKTVVMMGSNCALGTVFGSVRPRFQSRNCRLTKHTPVSQRIPTVFPSEQVKTC